MSDTTTRPGPGVLPPEQRRLSQPNLNPSKPLRSVQTMEDLFSNTEFLDRIKQSVPAHMSPQRMLRTMVSAVQKTPLLLKADLKSVIGVFLTCSQVGLEPGTPLQHAHIIPFKRTKWNPATRQREDAGVEVQLIFGYPGLLDLSYRSPLVTSIGANVVWPEDEFDYEYGTNAHLRHVPKHGARGRPIEQARCAYMVAKLRDGFAFEVVPIEEVLRIRNGSQAFRLALSMKEEAESKGRKLPLSWTEAPWVKFDVAMARKTAFRAGSKWLPRSVELASVIAIDEAQERRRNVDWSSVIDADPYKREEDNKEVRDYVGAAAMAADGSDEEDGPAEPPQASGNVFPGATIDHAPQQQPAQPAQPAQQPAAQPAAEPPPPAQEDPGPQPRDEKTADKPARAARAPAKPRNAPAAPPPFEATMFNAYGEPLPAPVESTRVAWAEAYAAQWRDCTERAVAEALAEFNAEAVADVIEDPKAAAIIEALVLPSSTFGRQETPPAEPAQETAQAAAQEPAQETTGEAFPAATPEPAPGPEPEPVDPDETWANNLIAQAERSTRAEVTGGILKDEKIVERVRALKASKPPLGKRIELAFQQRLSRKD